MTTSPKAKIEGATHIEFHEDQALEIANQIVKMAIDNYPNRDRERRPHPRDQEPVVAGFSHEYIRYMLGGTFREGLEPLNDNIINGKIQGVAAIVGCNNARATQDEGIINLVQATSSPERRAGGGHGLRRARLGQARLLDPRDVPETPAPASPRCARPPACRRCCTWGAAWTTRASSPSSPTSSRPVGWATTSTRSRPWASRPSTTARRRWRSPRTAWAAARTSSSAASTRR